MGQPLESWGSNIIFSVNRFEYQNDVIYKLYHGYIFIQTIIMDTKTTYKWPYKFPNNIRKVRFNDYILNLYNVFKRRKFKPHWFLLVLNTHAFLRSFKYKVRNFASLTYSINLVQTKSCQNTQQRLAYFFVKSVITQLSWSCVPHITNLQIRHSKKRRRFFWINNHLYVLYIKRARYT